MKQKVLPTLFSNIDSNGRGVIFPLSTMVARIVFSSLLLTKQFYDSILLQIILLDGKNYLITNNSSSISLSGGVT